MAENRAADIVDTWGEYTITVKDSLPIDEGKTFAQERHVVIDYKGTPEKEFTYPAYRIWTLLAHWSELVKTEHSGV